VLLGVDLGHIKDAKDDVTSTSTNLLELAVGHPREVMADAMRARQSAP
jgi:hypothetical protein